jgi:hypothetical protein
MAEAILEASAVQLVAAARQLTFCHTAPVRVRMVMKISSKFAEVTIFLSGREVHKHATGISIGLACTGPEGSVARSEIKYRLDRESFSARVVACKLRHTLRRVSSRL